MNHFKLQPWALFKPGTVLSTFFLLIIFSLLLFNPFDGICRKYSKDIEVINLTCEYRTDPLGMDSKKPLLGWNISSLQRNILQVAYRILVSDDLEKIKQNTGNVWDTMAVKSNQSIQVPYNGTTLKAGKTYYWKVMIWDNKQHISSWSKIASWQMGLLQTADWKGAKWIAYQNLPDSLKVVPYYHGKGPEKPGTGKDILPLLRKEFSITKTVKKAFLYITGLGHFEARINGKKIGDNFLDQGWTQYEKHALYVTFDLTEKLRNGSNTLGVMLGNGFYYIPRERYRKLTGAYGYPKMICLLAIEFEDGTFQDVVSDPLWKTSPGPITYSSIYGGEDYDATLEQKGWDANGFSDTKWKPAIEVKGVPRLYSQMAYPLKIFENFKAVKITQPRPGKWVYDLGQNASGIPAITVKGKKGSTIRITPAELLTDDGLVTQQAVGSPVYFEYTLKGKGNETWSPQFTYYGFRYIQIEGAVPARQDNKTRLPVMLSVKGLHTRNAAPKTGDFTSSNDLFNRTYKLINWAVKSNMASVLTDCPHREKLGWLEEAHLVGASIRYNYDIASLCKKIIRDMIAAQDSTGLVPDIAPEYVRFQGGFRDSPEWGSNSIILPWYMYQWYGDQQILEESYPMMQRYVAYLESKSKEHILSHGLGDWFDIGPLRPGVSQLTPLGVTATSIYYYDLDILTHIARLLNKNDDAKRYEKQAKEVKEIFNKTFFNSQTNQYATGSQTANAMAVYMGLVKDENKDAVVKNIIQDIRNRNNGLTAGDIGYRYLLRVLDDAGRSDVIFDMNSRTDVPGYGYQLANGATSLTESWQAYRFVSNNHFMLGHLMEWFYSGLGGIRPADNSMAFKEIAIRPEPVGDVTSAKVSYKSPYGFVRSEWEKGTGLFELIAEVPPNTTVTFYLPSKETSKILESGKDLKSAGDLRIIGYEKGKTVVSAGSGIYKFSVIK